MIEQQRPLPLPRRASAHAYSALQLHLPPDRIRRPSTTVQTTAATASAGKMSYHRPLSPGGRRIQNPARASDSFIDPYTQSRHNSYTTTTPRTSGVIPLSTQTFVNHPAPQSARERPAERLDPYTGRPRRSSLVDTQRGSAPAVTQLPSRSRPTVVQNDVRPASPLKVVKDYYITPATTEKPLRNHKKLYSVDDGSAKLVADVDISVGQGQDREQRHHRRRESVERPSGAYRGGLTAEKDKDRGRREYHANGGHSKSLFSHCTAPFGAGARYGISSLALSWWDELTHHLRDQRQEHRRRRRLLIYRCRRHVS